MQSHSDKAELSPGSAVNVALVLPVEHFNILKSLV